MINFTLEELLERYKNREKHDPEHISTILFRVMENLYEETA